jgi:Fic family protein
MSALEKFLHARSAGIPLLLKAALSHVQFENMHPFLDGNGLSLYDLVSGFRYSC